jgi:hypothetical protein
MELEVIKNGTMFGISDEWMLDVVNKVMNYGQEPKPHNITEVISLMLKECNTIEEMAAVCFHCGILNCRLALENEVMSKRIMKIL